jgi:hypothetical protein
MECYCLIPGTCEFFRIQAASVQRRLKLSSRYRRICALAGMALAKGMHLPPRFPLEELKGYEYIPTLQGESGSVTKYQENPIQICVSCRFPGGDPDTISDFAAMALNPQPLPLHRPLEFQSALPMAPRLPARAAPNLPPRVPRIIDNQRRLPPAPGLRPSIQEPPMRNDIRTTSTGEHLCDERW